MCTCGRLFRAGLAVHADNFGNTPANFYQQEMRKEMLSLSTKTERDDHVWKFRPLPAQAGQENLAAAEAASAQQEAAPVGVETTTPRSWGGWFGGASKPS